ncbi:hypothetical protein, partial [uncultured Desulfovibrio sp.]|uniref:hypothetical protein n=1 Tax=uncultured Desulfovibrio sp. TaxID=167968 RepID=UPI002637D537
PGGLPLSPVCSFVLIARNALASSVCGAVSSSATRTFFTVQMLWRNGLHKDADFLSVLDKVQMAS